MWGDSGAHAGALGRAHPPLTPHLYPYPHLHLHPSPPTCTPTLTLTPPLTLHLSPPPQPHPSPSPPPPWFLPALTFAGWAWKCSVTWERDDATHSPGRERRGRVQRDRGERRGSSRACGRRGRGAAEGPCRPKGGRARGEQWKGSPCCVSGEPPLCPESRKLTWGDCGRPPSSTPRTRALQPGLSLQTVNPVPQCEHTALSRSGEDLSAVEGAGAGGGGGEGEG